MIFDDDDRIPSIEMHRGIPLHEVQSPYRLALVRSEIDRAVAISDLAELVAFAKNPGNAPEARLLAGSKAEAILAGHSEQRQEASSRALSRSKPLRPGSIA